MKKSIGCPCEKNFMIDVHEVIDLDLNPEFIDKICDGSFMSFICPGCGKIHKPEFQVMITWKSKNINFEVLTELERIEFYGRKKDKPGFETIIGYPELADRIAIIKNNLNPTVIEALKYYILAKAEEAYPNRDVIAWYYGKGPEGIEFHLEGIKAGEMAVMRLPQELYDKTCEKLKKHPKDDVFTSLRYRSYLSVQNLFRPEAFK